MMTIINYGLGNIQAFVNVYKRLHIPVVVATNAAELADASKLILPGVGSFDHAMEKLNQSGIREQLTELVVNRKIPVLGVCVGMQMFADGSEEGAQAGLGWVPGQVQEFRAQPGLAELAQPHMGWNDVAPREDIPLFRGLESDARFYFLHSYYYHCADAKHVAATADYGLEFSCAISSENVYGVQFHPEKSHHYGVTLLKNFAEF